MAQWFDERCKQLLDELNHVPDTDDADDLRLRLIRVAMRESSLEMFRRAARNSKAMLEEMGEDMHVTIQEVEKKLLEDIAPDVEPIEHIMEEFENVPGITEAMARAEEKFRSEPAEIATDDESGAEPPVQSEPLSAGELNLDKFLKKPGEDAPTTQNETQSGDTDPDKPQRPSPDARIKINSSILRRD